MAEFSMDKLVQVLHDEHGVNAYVDMTGGMVATIFAGPTWIEPEVVTSGETWMNERHAVMAGPGEFSYTEDSLGYTEEFSWGMEDNGVTASIGFASEDETVESIAARIASRVKVNMHVVQGLHWLAGGTYRDPAVEAVTLTDEEEALVATLIGETTEQQYWDWKPGYLAFTGWDLRARADRKVGEDVEAEDVMAVEVRLLGTGAQTGEAGAEVFRGLLRDAPFAVRSGIYGVMTPAGRSLRVRIVAGSAAHITDEEPFIPGHPSIPMPEPEETFVSVYDPEDVNFVTLPPVWEGMLSDAARNLVDFTYRAYLPEQDVTVGLRVKGTEARLVALVGA